jgi:hypothetical protein
VQTTYPLLWPCSAEANRVTGNGYVAGKMGHHRAIVAARSTSKRQSTGLSL